MNDRQFYAINTPARSLEEATSNDFQDVTRLPSGALVRNILTVEIVRGVPAWHSAAMVLDPHTRKVAPLVAIPLRLHAELRTMVARLLIGVGQDPSDVHPRELGWHCYRLCTHDEIAKIPEPAKLIAAGPAEPLIVRPGETVVPDDEQTT